MRRARLPVLAFAVLVFAAFVGGSIAAVAQQSPTTTTTPSTPTTAPATTTTSPPQEPSPTPTTAYSPTQPAKAAPTTTTTSPNAPRVVPPDAQKVINGVKRSGPNNTGALLAALAPLRDFGLTDEQVAIVGFGRFPVAGYANFVDDWLMPRFTPVFHLHQGTDIWAPMGTPVRSPGDGVLRQTEESTGGVSVYVKMADGTEFYGTHLSAWVKGQKSGQTVRTGDVIGFVGNTGNADGGPPHLHFQISPKGAGWVDPKPYLDQWIKDAIASAPAVIASMQTSRPRAVVATALTREATEGSAGLFAAPASPPRSQLLWAAAASPSAGPVHFAQAEVAAAVRDAGWSTLTRAEAARLYEWQAADTAAKSVLAFFTPRALWDVLSYNTQGS